METWLHLNPAPHQHHAIYRQHPQDRYRRDYSREHHLPIKLILPPPPHVQTFKVLVVVVADGRGVTPFFFFFFL